MPPEFLKKHGDYQRVYREGRKGSAPLMGWFVAGRAVQEPSTQTPGTENTENVNSAVGRNSAAHLVPIGTRIGLTVPKTLGKAVDRNRMKRRMREAVRRQPDELLAAQLDVVLHPRRSVLTCDFDRLERDIAKVLREVAARRDAKRGDSK